MNEYIKKSEAVDVIVKYPYEIAGKTATAIKMIEDLPSADVVEVVRCKDCVYCRPYNDGKLYCHKKADIFVPMVDANDFCSYGERRG